MGNYSKKIDVEKIISYGDDLVEVLKDKKDLNIMDQCLQHSLELLSSCNLDSNEVLTSIQDYQKKIDDWRKKTQETKSEVAADEDLDSLEKELEDELQREQLLKEELRVIVNDIAELENQRLSIEERKQSLKKLEQEEIRAQRKLSMYASVSKVIPNLDDGPLLTGHIVDRDKRVVQKFEFNRETLSAFDICQTTWKMINKL